MGKNHSWPNIVCPSLTSTKSLVFLLLHKGVQENKPLPKDNVCLTTKTTLASWLGGNFAFLSVISQLPHFLFSPRNLLREGF